jgi:hypothetical protein
MTGVYETGLKEKNLAPSICTDNTVHRMRHIQGEISLYFALFGQADACLNYCTVLWGVERINRISCIIRVSLFGINGRGILQPESILRANVTILPNWIDVAGPLFVIA